MGKTINQVSVFLENSPGQLSDVLGILKNNNVDIFALNISETENYGVMRIIVQDPKSASSFLNEAGYVTSLSQVYLIGVPNVLGGLKGFVDDISKNGINIDYMYSMVDTGNNGMAYMIIAVNDFVKMNKFLEEKNILTGDSVMSILVNNDSVN